LRRFERGDIKKASEMPSEREKMESWSSTQLFDSLSNSEPGTLSYNRALAEVRRRGMETDQKSADAAMDAAKSSRLSARYALVAAVVAVISLVVSIVSYLRPPH
jgi:hypothetical protein